MSELAVGSLAGLAANSYVIDVASGSQLTQPGMVLQVVSTTKTDTFSTTSASYVDITGMSVTITPSSSSSKVLVLVQLGGLGADVNESAHVQLAGGNTSGFIGDANSTNTRATVSISRTPTDSAGTTFPASITYLDSPATTSTTTYKVQMRRGNSGAAYLNRPDDTSTAVNRARTASSITVMEIAG